MENEIQKAPSRVFPSREELESLKEYVKIMMSAGFVPDKYKNNEAKCLALALRGWEIGVPPSMAWENLFEGGDGKLGMQAYMMRALIFRSGVGTIVPTELTDTGATVKAIRYGTQGEPVQERTFSFTLEDAERAGLGGEAWQKYPRDLCYARATSAAARAMFSDVLMGFAYTPEELASFTRAPKKAAEPPAKKEQGVTPAPAESAVPGPASAAVSSSAVKGRELTRVFQVAAEGGGTTPLRTAGITVEQLRAVGKLSKQASGAPDDGRWKRIAELGRAYLDAVGAPTIRHLREDEGEHLIAVLQGVHDEYNARTQHVEPESQESPVASEQAEAALQKANGADESSERPRRGRPPKHPPVTAETIARLLDTLGLTDIYDRCIGLIEARFGKPIAELDQKSLVSVVNEIKMLGRDATAFRAMVLRTHESIDKNGAGNAES